LSNLVRPGVLEVRANLVAPTRALISEDFPTLERPAKATSGKSGAGKERGVLAEVKNRALSGFIEVLPS
jgi:hypothetical protein